MQGRRPVDHVTHDTSSDVPESIVLLRFLIVTHNGARLHLFLTARSGGPGTSDGRKQNTGRGYAGSTTLCVLSDDLLEAMPVGGGLSSRCG